MKKVMILFLLLSSGCADNVLSGTWSWDVKDKTTSFSIDVKEVDGVYLGQYCAVVYSGRKSDCAIDEEQSFKFKNTNSDEYVFDFISSFSGTSGVAKLSFNKNKLIWEIIKTPKGDYYAPSHATLIQTGAGS